MVEDWVVTESRTPQHSGDGYSYGGDYILNVNGVALNFGQHLEEFEVVQAAVSAFQKQLRGE